MSKKVAVYCRVSTPSDLQQHSLAAQERYYENLICSSKDYIFVGMYIDTESGLSMKKRSRFKVMLSDCRKKKIDLIITKSVSRFSRNSVDFLKVMRELKKLSVDVYFENESVQLSEERNELRMTTCAALAQEESMMKSKSIKWGLNFGFATGNSGMANRVCYGFTKDDDGNLVIDRLTSENVKLIFNLYLNGYSLSGIAKELLSKNIPSPTGKESWTSTAIDKILSNEKYIGNVLLQKTYVPDVLKQTQRKNNGELPQYLYEYNHEGIIDSITFDAVQEERKKRSNIIITDKGKQERKSARFSSSDSLSGKIICDECGRNFRRITTHSGEIVWRCAGRVEKNGNCLAETVKQSTIDKLLKQRFGESFSIKDVHGITVNKDEIVII